MKKHAIISIILIAVFVIVPMAVEAATFVNKTASFGGKVIASKTSIATCIGFGTGPVILASNLRSLGSAVNSATSSNNSAVNRTAGIVSGLYGAIPYYAKITIIPSIGGISFVSQPPKPEQWILGRADIVPDTHTCLFSGTVIPFPVRDTNNYGVSNNSSILR